MSKKDVSERKVWLKVYRSYKKGFVKLDANGFSQGQKLVKGTGIVSWQILNCSDIPLWVGLTDESEWVKSKSKGVVEK